MHLSSVTFIFSFFYEVREMNGWGRIKSGGGGFVPVYPSWLPLMSLSFS